MGETTTTTQLLLTCHWFASRLWLLFPCHEVSLPTQRYDHRFAGGEYDILLTAVSVVSGLATSVDLVIGFELL
jgi:hypothetical protein